MRKGKEEVIDVVYSTIRKESLESLYGNTQHHSILNLSTVREGVRVGALS